MRKSRKKNRKRYGREQCCQENVHITERRIRRLFIRALQGNSSAYKKLGCIFLHKNLGNEYRKLGELCLLEAVKMGNEEAYFLYHRLFSGGKQVLDDPSYLQCWSEYQSAKSPGDKKRLKRYLLLGTNRQKRMCKSHRRSGKTGRDSCEKPYPKGIP